MRLISLVLAAFALLVTGSSFAQGWIEYVSRADFFTVNFPREPEVRDITYPTEYRVNLPGRLYSVENGPNRYSVTVIDYANIEEVHAKRLEGCQAYPNLCRNPWILELEGALEYAAWSFLQRDAEVTFYGFYRADAVEGRQIQVTNADQSFTYAAIHLHENRLYIFEETVPSGGPPPGLFQQSVGFIDEEGTRIRYRSTYVNGYPPPPRVQYGQ